MNFRVPASKFKAQGVPWTILFFLLTAHCSLLTAFGQNNLQKIEDGGHIEKWLVSNTFPAEIDAGMWENFNRFNIESLPQKDWLAPFGGIQKIKPQTGTQKATVQIQRAPDSRLQTPDFNAALPEVGATSSAKVPENISEISWREITAASPRLDFYALAGAKQTGGTAYAASFINSDRDDGENRFIETDGFLGAIWLNGEKIYDGYVLNAPRKAAAKFRKGVNFILVRASGVSGDYWRKNGGFSALIRFWKSEEALNKSLGQALNVADGTIFYLEGFHVDPVYLHDQRGYSRVTLSNTNQYIGSLRADPRYGVYLSEIDYLKPYLDTHPEDREFLREAVRQGRVGTGGAYNQFNELTIGGESIIRNILYGQAMHEAMLGKRATSLALWDVFGHAPQISQIARKSGFSGITWSKKISGFEPFFYDYALDGSPLLHRRLDYAYSFSGFGSGKNYELDNFIKMTGRKFQEARSFNSSVDLRINAADFTPPWTNLVGNVERLETNRPNIRVSGQAQDFYFDALNKEIAEGKTKPPVTSRDKLFFHVGVMAARSDLKVAHRLAENMTLTAEKFGAIAYLRGAKYPDLALDKAWRQIFFGSHHDAITGTPSDNAFLDLVHGYREAFELSKDALDDSLDFIAGQINTNSKFQIPNSKLIPIVVFNPMSWNRTDEVKLKLRIEPGAFGLEVRDSEGNIIPATILDANPPNRFGSQIFSLEFVAKDVPSLGYKTFYAAADRKGGLQLSSAAAEPGKNKKQNIQTANDAPQTIENEFYRVIADPNRGGAITSIYDKQAKREIVSSKNGHYANEIAALREELTKKNVIYPAWEFWTTGEKKFSAENRARVFAAGRRRLYIEGVMPNMRKYVQTIELHDGVKRIDFKTELVDYKGAGELYVVNFPLNLTGGALVTEDRFGTVVRNQSKGFLDFRTNADKLVSGAPVYAVNNWAEYGATLTLNFVSQNSVGRGDAATRREGEKNAGISASPRPNVTASQKIIASVSFKPTALVRPHGENYENLTEQIVSSLIKRGVSVTPFYDDNDIERRKNLPIEDSTMPKKLNDDIAYHGFRITLGGEKENLYSAALLKQVSAVTKQKFEERLLLEGFAYLFLYDRDVPEGWQPVPVLMMAGNLDKAIERITVPIRQGATSAQPSLPESTRLENEYNYGKLNTFEITLPFESFAGETNPYKNLPQVENYGVALINNGTPAVSLENPDTLTLFLTHTAPFPGVNLPFEFVPENKTHVFTYALYPHAQSWREANTVRVGYDFNNPLIARQTDIHKGDLPVQNSFLMTGKDIVLSALKLGDNPQADFRLQSGERPLIARFYETEGKAINGSTFLRFHPTKGIFQTDLLEKNDKFYFNGQNGLEESFIGEDGNRVNEGCCLRLPIELDPFEIQTYKIFGASASTDDKLSSRFSPAKELVQPVFSRYWMHNAGAAPLGNDAVKVSLRRVEQMNELSGFAYDDKYNQGGTTTTTVRVQVVNNYQDRNYKGEVTLEVPEDWRVVPDKLSFDIAPNGSFVKDVVVVAFPVKKGEEWERASGLIKARIEHEGQTFQDVLQIGKSFQLEWAAEKTENGVLVKIKNPHRQAIEGAVALIKPLETWAGNAYSSEPPAAAAREFGFSVPARGEITVSFPAAGYEPPGTWAIARIAYNGSVEYQRADGGKTK